MEFWVDLSEIVRNIAIGIAAGIGSWLAWRRLQPERSAAELNRRDHVVELFNRSVGQLSDDRLEVRLAAIYVLREVGRDFPDLTDPIFELLSVYIRERHGNYAENGPPEDLEAAIETVKMRIPANESV